MREAVFNALGSRGLPDGATALDLFAGTGALGIEALSRGADAVVFVEHDRAALSALRANLASTGVGDRATVVATRAEVWLQSDECHRAHFDVVFCDPPYAFGEWDELLAGVSADLVVAESDRPLDIAGFDVVRQRRYGTTFVTFAEPAQGRVRSGAAGAVSDHTGRPTAVSLSDGHTPQAPPADRGPALAEPAADTTQLATDQPEKS